MCAFYNINVCKVSTPVTQTFKVSQVQRKFKISIKQYGQHLIQSAVGSGVCNCSTWLQKLQRPQSCEISVAQVCMISSKPNVFHSQAWRFVHMTHHRCHHIGGSWQHNICLFQPQYPKYREQRKRLEILLIFIWN